MEITGFLTINKYLIVQNNFGFLYYKNFSSFYDIINVLNISVLECLWQIQFLKFMVI